MTTSSALYRRASTLTARSGLSADQGSKGGAPDPDAPRPGTSGPRSHLRLGFPLLGADLVATVLSWTLSPTTPQSTTIVAATLIVVFTFTGRYRDLRLNLSVIDDLPYLAGVVVVGYAPSMLARQLAGDPLRGSTLLTQACIFAFMVALLRTVVYVVVRYRRRQAGHRHRTLILGSGNVGSRLASAMLDHPSYGLEPVGFVDSHPRASRGDVLPLPVLGRYDQVESLVFHERVDRVVVAYGGRGEAELVDVLRTLNHLDVDVAVVPRLYELHSARDGVEEVRGVPLVWARRPGPRRASWAGKRAFDVVVSATALVLLAPVLAVVALAVRLQGGPGVIFRQERVGLDGKAFELLKFRSLRPADDDESQTRWNVSQDSRLSTLGRFLRRTSLDETPQLWNVLRGDMSLVGPRPERPFFVNQFSSQFRGYPARHRVPVGLTGWAQAHGLRGDTSIEERARFDNYYIENWSLWLDVKILAKTAGEVLRQAGA